MTSVVGGGPFSGVLTGNFPAPSPLVSYLLDESKHKVLIVEDDPLLAMQLSSDLDRLGYIVSGVASSGERALRLVEENQPAVILMDVFLGGEFSGTQTAQKICSRFEIPIVYLTGYSNAATISEIEASGCHEGFLTKPVRVEDLGPTIRLAIERHARRERLLAAESCRNLEACSRKFQDKLEQFTRSAGHDLKEPVRNASNILQLLALHMLPQISDEDRDLLERAQKGLAKMNELLQDLLDSAHSNSPRPTEFRATSLEQAFICAKENLWTSIEETGATLTYEPLPMVYGDPARLVRLFQNLLANSLKYRRAEESPNIHISASHAQREWIIRISDNGIGFDQQCAETIFEPFTRLHNQEMYPGTGLGLMICREIVETHGGKIWANALPVHGAEFCFSLPDTYSRT